MAPLLKAISNCKNSIVHLNISHNKSINKAVPDLARTIRSCTKLEFLDISCLKMRKTNLPEIIEALTEALSMNPSIKHLYWSRDLHISNSLAKQFLLRLSEVPATTTLQEIKLVHVFHSRLKRDQMRNLFRSKPFSVVLFEPQHSEDDSQDHDKSEVDSEDGGSSTS